MKPPWPRSIRGQMIALVLIGLGVAQVCSFVIYQMQHQSTLRSMRDQHVLARLTSVVRLLADTPSALHERIVRAASSRPLRLTLADAPVPETPPPSRRSLRLQQQLAELTNRDRDDIRIGLRQRRNRRHGDCALHCASTWGRYHTGEPTGRGPTHNGMVTQGRRASCTRIEAWSLNALW